MQVGPAIYSFLFFIVACFVGFIASLSENKMSEAFMAPAALAVVFMICSFYFGYKAIKSIKSDPKK